MNFFMVKRNFFKFVLVGLLTAAAGELQVNVLVGGKGAGAYFSSMLLYVFFLALMYLLGKFLDRVTSIKKIDFIYYLAGGLFGLAIEWFLIGNAPWAGTGAIQAGMFAWWGAIFLVPRIFTTPIDALVGRVRKRVAVSLLVYSVVSVIIVSALPAGLRPAIAAVMIATSYLVVNFQFVPYLARSGFPQNIIQAFMWLLILAGVIDFVF